MKPLATLLLFLLAACCFSAELSDVFTVRNSTVGGRALAVHVLLDSPVTEDGGEIVSLVDNTSAVETPASVTVSKGRYVGIVSCPTFAVNTAVTRSITATLRTVSKTVYFDLVPAPVLKSIVLDYPELVGGEPWTARLSLSTHSDGATEVNVSSNSSYIVPGPGLHAFSDGSESLDIPGVTHKVGAVYDRTLTFSCLGVSRTLTMRLHPPQQITYFRARRSVGTVTGDFAGYTLYYGVTGFGTGRSSPAFTSSETFGVDFEVVSRTLTSGVILARVTATANPPRVVTVYAHGGGGTKSVKLLHAATGT